MKTKVFEWAQGIGKNIMLKHGKEENENGIFYRI